MRALPLAAAFALALAACARPAAPVVVPETPDATPSWVTDAPVRLTVGRPQDLSGTRSLPKAVVTVEQVTEKATCPTNAAQPKNGQFVAVRVSAQRLDQASGFAMAVYEWSALDGAGKEVAGTSGLVTGLCLTDGSALRLAYDASGRTQGTVLIDAPETVTAIVAKNTTVTPPVVVTVEMPAR